MGDSVLGAHHLVSLDPDPLIERASAATGLTDFGDFDGDWRGRLARLVEEIERTARLPLAGGLMTREGIPRGLVSPLLLTPRPPTPPPIAPAPIEAPLRIPGPP